VGGREGGREEGRDGGRHGKIKEVAKLLLRFLCFFFPAPSFSPFFDKEKRGGRRGEGKEEEEEEIVGGMHVLRVLFP